MSFNDILVKFYRLFFDKNSSTFLHSQKEDRNFLSRFSEPDDDIERSYYQYLCQEFISDSHIRCFISNFMALLLIIPYKLKYRMNRKKEYKSTKYDSALTSEFIKGFLPNDYYGNFVFQDIDSGSLSKSDISFLNIIAKRYPFSFFFYFKCMTRIALYSDLIKKYSPNIIFTSAEYSFTSSVLTLYCETKSVKHVNVMHGEKLYNIREAFCRFHEFYVWDKHYIDLFINLRATKTKYIVDKKIIPSVKIVKNDNHCTYYMQKHSKEQALRIKNSLDNTGLDYSIRFHPVYSTEIERRIFQNSKIESNSINIYDSIANSGKVVSGYSTVLFQAYLMGVEIIIDDISNPQMYNELKDRSYIMLSKPHKLLSEIIK